MTEPNIPLDQQADRLIGLVGRLNDAVETSNKQVAELADANRHNRRLIRVLAVSIAFDVLLSLGLGFAFAKSHTASLNAERAAAAAATASEANKATIKATCLASNEARTRNVQLWQYIISLNPPTTPETKARADQLLAYVNDTFRQRDCGI